MAERADSSVDTSDPMAVAPSGRMAGKVAVVVGAGQTPGDTIGNGRAISLLLAREGAQIVAVDRDLESAAKTCQLIADEGGSALPVQADITSEADCERLASEGEAAFGRIDILVNNVGIGTGDAGPTSLTEEAWDLIFAVNLKGMWLTCKHVLPRMRARATGAIVNISSLAAVAAAPMLAYKTSKAGVNSLTESLAGANAKHGIRVNAVMPGLMDTPMAIVGMGEATGIAPDDLRRLRDSAVPLGGRMGSAWDVAHAVLFLASEEARFITGAILPVDGGQRLRVG
jgi:NAD(P)-dependent dehydrogenase (short-subunit alcohol dehydrogenase family)